MGTLKLSIAHSESKDEEVALFFIKDWFWGWRDGSEVKSLDCSSRGPEFNSQQPHGGSQPSMRSGVLFWHASIHGRNVVYIINKY